MNTTKAKFKKWHYFIDNSYDNILIKRYSKCFHRISISTQRNVLSIEYYHKQFCRPYEKCIILIVLTITNSNNSSVIVFAETHTRYSARIMFGAINSSTSTFQWHSPALIPRNIIKRRFHLRWKGGRGGML